MSDETKAAVDAAIEAHFADEHDGALVTGYLLQVIGSSAEDFDTDTTRTLRCMHDRQNFITTLGLAEYAVSTVRDNFLVGWMSDDEDD